MLGMGFGAAFIMVTSQTLLQQETPKELLGRVTSSLMSLMAFSQVIAMFTGRPGGRASRNSRSLFRERRDAPVHRRDRPLEIEGPRGDGVNRYRLSSSMARRFEISRFRRFWRASIIMT